MILELRLYSSVCQNSLYHHSRQHLAFGMLETDQGTDSDLRVCAQRSLFCYVSSILDQFLEFHLYQLLRGFTSTIVLFFFFFFKKSTLDSKEFSCNAGYHCSIPGSGIWEDPPEKEMATHSSVLAWRIPRTGEPGGLPSLGSHRVGHD